MRSVDELLGLYGNSAAGLKLWDMVYLLQKEEYYSWDGGIYNEDELVRAEIASEIPFNVDCGATRVCIVFKKLVLKKNFSGKICFDDELDDFDIDNPFEYETDYCKIEGRVYQEAVKEGLEEFFAEIQEISDGVYAQPTCEKTIYNCDYYKDFGKMYSKEVHDYLNYIFNYKIPTEVLNYWARTKRIGKLRKLAEFIKAHEINDLHRENMGWFGDEIKLFDYCGFDSKTEETFI